MPKRPPKVCCKPGCAARATHKGYCGDHQKPAGNWRPDRFRGSRHQRGYDAAWDRLRIKILQRDKYLCQPSLRDGETVKATEVDHIIPKSQGGTDDPSNLQAISYSRHKAKTARETGRGGEG